MSAMNFNETPGAKNTITKRCLQSCQKLLAEMTQVRKRIANEFQASLNLHEHLLQLALNEAEALARQTAYPHLLFPSLAMEKVQAVVGWQKRQMLLRQRHSIFAEAA